MRSARTATRMYGVSVVVDQENALCDCSGFLGSMLLDWLGRERSLEMRSTL